MFEKLLEYQKLDGEILKLTREFENNPVKISLKKTATLIKDNQTKLLELDSEADRLLKTCANFRKEFEDTFEEIEKFKDPKKFDNEKEVSDEIEKVNAINNKLTSLERNISKEQEQIGRVVKMFDSCRNNIVVYKLKYKDLKEQFDKLNSDYEEKLQKLLSNQKEIEKIIDKDLLNLYKHKRADKIFPVFVPLNDNACGGCSMSLPNLMMNRLKSQGYLECEQCRRVIYSEESR